MSSDQRFRGGGCGDGWLERRSEDGWSDLYANKPPASMKRQAKQNSSRSVCNEGNAQIEAALGRLRRFSKWEHHFDTKFSGMPIASRILIKRFSRELLKSVELEYANNKD